MVDEHDYTICTMNNVRLKKMYIIVFHKIILHYRPTVPQIFHFLLLQNQPSSLDNCFSRCNETAMYGHMDTCRLTLHALIFGSTHIIALQYFSTFIGCHMTYAAEGKWQILR